jgi:hypothetical protein
MIEGNLFRHLQQVSAVSLNVSDLHPNTGKITEGSSGLNNHGGVVPVGPHQGLAI